MLISCLPYWVWIVIVFYALLPGGYIVCSVTIELTYAYAKGKKIFVSEAPEEFAARSMVSEICSPQQFIA